MKKYFISFKYSRGINGNGSANCTKTSLNKLLDMKQIRKWEEEIKNSTPGIERIDILFFREIK